MLIVLGLGQFERLVLHVHALHVHALHVHVLHVRCYVGWGDRIFVGFRRCNVHLSGQSILNQSDCIFILLAVIEI